jgi:hypothetical protein
METLCNHGKLYWLFVSFNIFFTNIPADKEVKEET